MSTGPGGGSGGTTGPGHLFALLDFLRHGRARVLAAATKASARSTHATPLTTEQRVDNYLRQNRSDRMTPRQLRRADHKAARAARATA